MVHRLRSASTQQKNSKQQSGVANRMTSYRHRALLCCSPFPRWGWRLFQIVKTIHFAKWDRNLLAKVKRHLSFIRPATFGLSTHPSPTHALGTKGWMRLRTKVFWN